MSATLLLFNFSPEKARLLRTAAAELGIVTRAVLPSEHQKPLAALLSSPAAQAFPAAPAFSGEMLVMASFSPEQMDRFLDRIRPLTPSALKAVTTPHNLFWTGAALAAELAAERSSLSGKP